MKCNEVSELLSAYADGEVSGRDAAMLNAHIEQCGACRAELDALDALQSRLTDMMGEPMEGKDVSDLVMASLPARQRPALTRWAWVGAVACLLAFIGLRLMLPPSHTEPTPPRVVTGRPPRTAPAPTIPKHPAPLAAQKRHDVIRRPVVVYRPRPRHLPVRRLKSPAPPPPLPETAQLVVTSKATDGRTERILTLKLGDTTLCRARVTEITLAPNEDAATTVRPELQAIGHYGG